MSQMTCLILHRKSANEPYVKEAVKSVRKEGIDAKHYLVPLTEDDARK